MPHAFEESSRPGPALNDQDLDRPRSPSQIKQEATPSPDIYLKQEPRRPLANGHASSYQQDQVERSRSPSKPSSMQDSPILKDEEETIGGDVSIVQEPGEEPKLARTMSKKIVSRPPQLFPDLPDATSEAQSAYETMLACSYGNKYLGATDHAMECECNEEWDAVTRTNNACGDDSDCINRATKMECLGDCTCGRKCQNQRFKRHQYADVSVIRTEKKGYGLRANVTLPAHTFIYEYIGEVIGEAAFRRRMVQYDEEGIKHFYFMSLNKGEFVDATKKGNLGRFCNHSCNPNCYVDKWVVGDKLRMGIFSERKILANEELVFNYNVDRYGANPQPCYCGEPNCTGFIGGRTQTERATKLSAATIEALGIEDGDGWDLAVAKRGKKKKVGEDDEEYVDRVEARSLDESGVVKVMATLMQCKEKWIAVKLLSRIQQCEEERVRNRVVKMHGYQILKSQLATWVEDSNVVLQILSILHMLPRITRNKIQDSGIESVVEKLMESDDDRVREESSSIVKIWSALEMGYRIPRHKRDPGVASLFERERPRRRSRSKSQSRSRSTSPVAPKGPVAPTGPRAGFAPPVRAFFPPRPPFRRQFGPPPLPAGWFTAVDKGKTYYYSATGATTWQRPSEPAVPPPPKIVTNEQRLQDIINNITAEPEKKETTPVQVTSSKAETKQLADHDRSKSKEKWRSLPLEKQKKIYQNTLSPVIQYVVDRFKNKLPKDELKRFAKEIAKQMVDSDFKHHRVRDPTKLSESQEKNMKKHVKAYFEKAVSKNVEREKRKAEKEVEGKSSNSTLETKPVAAVPPQSDKLAGPDEDIILSENEIEDDDEQSPSTQDDTIDSELKRKREADETPLTTASDDDPGTPLKKQRSELNTPAPPPPPPPPEFDADGAMDMGNEQDMDFADYGMRGDVIGYEEGTGLGLPPEVMDTMDELHGEDLPHRDSLEHLRRHEHEGRLGVSQGP